MFEATQDGLGKNAPVHSIHGSLLAVGELLRFIETVIIKFYFLYFIINIHCSFIMLNLKSMSFL